MTNIKTRFFLILSVLAAFFVPFMAVVAIENMKRENTLLSNQEIAASAKKDEESARYQYYLSVAQQRDALKKAMADSKSQYDKLLKDQPQLIQDSQKTVTQTTVEPVVMQKVVSIPDTAVSASSASTASKPKSSAKTKTS